MLFPTDDDYRHDLISDPEVELEYVLRAREGDAAAFELLIRAYEAELLPVAKYREDILYAAFEKIRQGLRTFDEGRVQAGQKPFGVWARKIVRNLLIDVSRTERREKTLFQSIDERFDISWVDNTEDRIVVEELLAQLAGVNKTYARVLKLRFLDGLASKEVAELLHTSANNIDKIVSRACCRLRAQLLSRRPPQGGQKHGARA